MGVVLSVNVGPAAEFRTGRVKRSGIVKAPVTGRVAVRGVNLAGDEQADRRHHGGPDQAIYAYARESYGWWEAELGRPLAHGIFGENLTVEGIEVDHAVIGERWTVGTTVLQVTSARIPCLKLAKRVGEPQFVKRFAAARRPGAYLRILQEGEIGAGDAVDVISRPDHGITVALVAEAWLFDPSLMPRLLEAGDGLAVRTRERVESLLAAQ